MSNPTLLQMPLAVNGDKNTIPVETGSNTGLFSQKYGFQSINSLPLSAGGKAISRHDYNGAMYLLSNILFYAQKGYTFEFDNTQDYFTGCEVIDPVDGNKYRCIADVVAEGGNPSEDTTHWERIFNESAFFYRMPSTTYTVGDVKYTANLPSWGFLTCITGGVAGSGELVIPVGTKAGDTITDGQVVWRLDSLTNMKKALAEVTGYGIVSGCEPTINNLTVTVGAGIVHLAEGTRKEISASSITLNNADSTNPRIDLVYITSAGEVAKVTGTASASPVVPSVPTGGISVATVSVAAGASTGTITDKRAMLPRFYNTGIVNVKDFGAVGDGVHDDTQAIQDAIDYAVKTQGTLLLPAFDKDGEHTTSRAFIHRKYLVSKTLNIKGLLRWQGAGSAIVVHSSDFDGDYVIVNCDVDGTFRDIQAWLFADHIWVEDLDQRASALNGVFLRLNHSYIDEICAYQFNGTGIEFSPCYDCVFGTIHTNHCGNDTKYAMVFSRSSDHCNNNVINYLLCHDTHQHGINAVMACSTVNLIHIEASHFDNVIDSDETIYGTKHKNHELEGDSLTINQIWVDNNQTTGLYETITFYGTSHSNTINNISGNGIEVNLTGSTSPLHINNISTSILATDSGAWVTVSNGKIEKLKSIDLKCVIENCVVSTIDLFGGKMNDSEIINAYNHVNAYQSTPPTYTRCWFRAGIGSSPQGGNIVCNNCVIKGMTLTAAKAENAGTFYDCTFTGTVTLDGQNAYDKSIHAYNTRFATMVWQNLSGGELITVNCKASSMTGWRTGWNAHIGEVTERIFSEKPTSGTGLRYVCTGTATWPNEFTAIVSMP